MHTNTHTLFFFQLENSFASFQRWWGTLSSVNGFWRLRLLWSQSLQLKGNSANASSLQATLSSSNQLPQFTRHLFWKGGRVFGPSAGLQPCSSHPPLSSECSFTELHSWTCSTFWVSSPAVSRFKVNRRAALILSRVLLTREAPRTATILSSED